MPLNLKAIREIQRSQLPESRANQKRIKEAAKTSRILISAPKDTQPVRADRHPVRRRRVRCGPVCASRVTSRLRPRLVRRIREWSTFNTLRSAFQLRDGNGSAAAILGLGVNALDEGMR